VETGAGVTNELAQKIAESLIGVADVTAVFSSRREILLKGQPVINLAGMDSLIQSKLSGFGYKTEVLSVEPSLVVRLSAVETRKGRKIPWLNIGLFLATIVTTLLAGAFWEGVDLFSKPSLFFANPLFFLSAGIPFSISLLTILLCHEFGHYFAARLHKVNVSLPYFIPGPSIIGTFGAFIRARSAFMNRRQLIDVGAAGPLSGLVVSIIVLIIGINSSTIQPIPSQGSFIIFGDSLLQTMLVSLVKGPIPDGSGLILNSVAFAGWVGLLVTMFNLLPIGQLDGGHIMYALFGKHQKKLAYIALLGLIVLTFWWTGWVVWLILSLLLKPAHPPTLIDEIPIGKARRIVGYISIFAFIICFMPVPIGYN
jgi:membrane-associated protease RseP (regulator of RpoE activity)